MSLNAIIFWKNVLIEANEDIFNVCYNPIKLTKHTPTKIIV